MPKKSKRSSLVKTLYCVSPIAKLKARTMPKRKENITGVISSDYCKHSKDSILGQWDKLVEKNLSGVWLRKSDLKKEFARLHKLCPNFGKRGGTDSKVFVEFTFSTMLKEGLILKETVR